MSFAAVCRLIGTFLAFFAGIASGSANFVARPVVLSVCAALSCDKGIGVPSQDIMIGIGTGPPGIAIIVMGTAGIAGTGIAGTENGCAIAASNCFVPCVARDVESGSCWCVGVESKNLTSVVRSILQVFESSFGSSSLRFLACSDMSTRFTVRGVVYFFCQSTTAQHE